MPPFHWLERTALRHDRFADFHWGFHLLLLPFSWIDPEAAAKAAPVVFASASFMALCFLLHRLSARHRLTWFSVALLSSPIFLMRLSQNKAPTVMLGLLLLIAWAAIERRDTALGLLCLAAGWVYPVVPLILAIAGAGLVCRAFTERRLPWRGALSVFAGISGSLLLHPDFPRNIPFIFMNLSEASMFRAGEFAPLRPRDILGNVGLLSVVYLLSLHQIVFGPRLRRPEAAWTFFILSSLMGLLTARYVRAIDYLPPFVALFAASALDERLGEWIGRLTGRLRPPWLALARAAPVLLLAAAAAAQSVKARDIVARNSASIPRRLEQAARWLAANTSEGEMVVNLSSGDFEELWLYDTKNTYLVGINVSFLRAESPGLFDVYARFYQSGDIQALRKLLQETAPARYLVASDRLPLPLLDAIASSPLFDTAYHDRSCIIAEASDFPLR